MSETIAQSLIVGGVAIISAVIGGVLPNIIHKKIKVKEIKRAKIESLYLDVENWFNHAFAIYALNFKLVLDGHINWNQYLDMIIKGDKSEGDFKRAKIIMYLYFNELEKDFTQLHKSIMELNDFIEGEVKLAYRKNAELSIFKSKHSDLVHQANNSLDILQKKMHKLAANLL